MLNSINTNAGATVALRQLGATGSELAVTRGRVSTGLRVASARDGGAVWAIAQTNRGDIRAMDLVLTGLARVESATDLAIASGEVVSGLLIQMREKALAASAGTLTAEARASLDQDFQQLKSQIVRAVESGGFNGLNLINGTRADYQVLAGIQTVNTVRFEEKPINGNAGNKKEKDPKFREVLGAGASTLEVATEAMALGGDNVVLASTAKLTVAADLPAVLTDLDTSIRNVSSALIRLGAASNAFAGQQTFLRKLQDTARAGVGQLVDADMAKEGARLQALQTREQLGIQALSIANRAPGVLLQLFRE